MKSAVLFLATGLSAIASASEPYTTINPCPSCPSSCKPPQITVTSQYQPVSTCSPHKVCTDDVCKIEPECSTYNWVSTVIPCDGGRSSTTVTNTDATVKLNHYSTVITSVAPCATKAPAWNGTGVVYGTGVTTSYTTAYQTVVVDSWAPYKEIGPLAIPGYSGSGLCTDCAEDKNGTKSQGVTVKKCLDGSCSTYPETWVSTKAAPATSTSQASYSSQTYCPSSGIYTIPVTTTCTASESGYTPITKTFTITTSVDKAMTVEITKTIYVTFSGELEPTAASSKSACPLSTSQYVASNGVHTIPITTAITPTDPGYTVPVTTTVYFTTTVTDAPRHVGCSTTVTLTFTSYSAPATVVSGITYKPSAPATYSATTSGAGYSMSSPSYSAGSISSSARYPMSTPSYPTRSMETITSEGGVYSTSSFYPTSTYTAKPVPTLGDWDYVGCMGSNAGFPSFALVETSGSMTVELCTSECHASGYSYAGVWTSECYCSSTLDESSSDAYGQCDIPCPGNAAESCGGNAVAAKMIRARAVSNAKLFDIYECPSPTSTTTTSDSTTSTGYATPDPSSDAEPAPEKRSLDADMELSAHKARDIKLRRGGMLRAEKKETANLRVKRDFGLKKPFGL